MHLEHKAGDKLSIDFAGDRLSILGVDGGEISEVEVFVAVLWDVDVIGEKTVPDAVLDRLVHNAQRVELKGESLRRKWTKNK
jgi:hypothetical protein